MRSDKLKYDLVIRQNGVKVAKGKNMNINETLAKMDRIANKKISGAIDHRLFGSIITSIACFGLFYAQIVYMVAA